jgi:hypothetical protein
MSIEYRVVAMFVYVVSTIEPSVVCIHREPGKMGSKSAQLPTIMIPPSPHQLHLSPGCLEWV